MPLVILDEPEAGIDLWSFNRLTETIRKLNREQGTTFILISHQEKLMSIADQIVCMKEGAIESVQSGHEFLKQLEGENSHVR
jgi:Fe-S cluster assembly ATP-binding protein